MKRLIVSRHPAAVEFVRQELPEFATAEVVTGNVSPGEVRGSIVAGVLPLPLVALTRVFYAIEFEGRPPRGEELSLEAMRAAGARIAPYRAQRLTSEEARLLASEEGEEP